MLIVDHVRLVKLFRKGINKFDKNEIVTGELKTMAKDLEMLIVALSQVTRSSQRRDDPSPQLTDLDGGGTLEQDADWAIGSFRRERWLRKNQPNDEGSREYREWLEKLQACKGQIELQSLKVRRGEDGQVRRFAWDGRRGRIAELGTKGMEF